MLCFPKSGYLKIINRRTISKQRKPLRQLPMKIEVVVKNEKSFCMKNHIANGPINIAKERKIKENHKNSQKWKIQKVMVVGRPESRKKAMHPAQEVLI